MRGERRRLHIDPYYCPPRTDGYDANSPRSSPSLSFSFSPPTDMSSISSAGPMSAAPEWRLCYVLCLYDFVPTDPDHLPFRKNEILEIVEKMETGWWAALRDDRIGWVPSTFLTELSDEAARSLKEVTEELRVYEYEAEKLFKVESVCNTSRSLDSASSPVSTRGYGYRNGDDDDWVPILAAGGKTSYLCPSSPSVHFVDFPDDIAPLPRISPPHSHSQMDALSIEAELGSAVDKESWMPSTAYPVSPATPMALPARPDIYLRINKPTPPTPPPPLLPSPSCASPRSPLNRSRSDSSHSFHARIARRRPILVNDFKSLSRLSVFLDSPRRDAAVAAADELQSAFGEVRAPPTPRRSDKVRQLTGDEDAQAFHNAKVAQANLPWYLQPSYSPDDIKLEYDGSVRAGTLPALVERLTVDPLKMTEEKSYRNVCLTTFSTFTTATELFDLLVERFGMDHPSSLTQEEYIEWREKKLRPVQKRVLAILTMWAENHGMLQDDPHIVLRLKEFLSMIVSPPSSALSAKLLLQSLDKLAAANASTSLLPPLPLTPSSIRQKCCRPSKNELTRFSPADLAAQLTLYEHRLYIKIRPRECLLWAKTQSGGGVANLSAYSATHDRIAAWVKTSVLASDGLGKRADIVDYWIKTAEKCRAINNFSSMSAIIAALSSAVISRLHLTWAHTSRNHQFETLSRLNEPSGNFSVYRSALQSVEGSCAPFIGIFLTDIVHINDQMKDDVQFPLLPKQHRAKRCVSATRSEPERTCRCSTATLAGSTKTQALSASPSSLPSSRPEFPCPVCTTPGGPTSLGPPLINFIKRQKWYDAVRAIVRFQNKPLNISENPTIMGFINEQLMLAAAKLRDPLSFWSRSQELQANEVSHADIRKGLEAAGF